MVSAAASGESITLAHGGKAAAVIVIGQNASPRAQAAAMELQQDIQQICGVELPVHHDGKAVEGTGLYIGQCQTTQDSDLPEKTSNPETYSISVRDGGIYFNGRYPTPTYFAVASFIENNLGVRWFAPGELWTYIPRGTPGELTVDVKSVVSVPGTSPRIWSGHAWTDDWKTWDLRNKAVESEVVHRRNMQNNMYRIFPPSKYAKTHPEYYPLINGKRWIPENDKASHWWPCIGNPDVLRLTVEYANHYFDTHPDEDSFSLGMDDISHVCKCDKCLAMAPDLPDRYYMFINEVAKEVRKTHPNRYIGLLIYDIVRPLPKQVKKLEPNVFGYMTATCFQWWWPQRKQEVQMLTREWAKRCQHLSRYDYYGMGTITPRFAPHFMAEELKLDDSLGFEGMYTEVYTFLPDTAPMIWALAKMQWDHSLDVDPLLNEFYQKMYGSAAGTMKQYFDLLEKSWDTARPGRTHGWVHRNILAQAQAMSVPDLDAAMALVTKALDEARDPKVRQRIEINREGLRYGGYAIRLLGIAEQIATMHVSDAASAGQVLKLDSQMDDLTAEAKAFWGKAAQRQDLLGANLRGLADFDYLQIGKIDRLKKPAAANIAEARQWFTNHPSSGNSASN
jgi:hypothetical protein